MKQNKGLILALSACVLVSLSSGCKPKNVLNQAKRVKPGDVLNQIKRVKPLFRVFSAVPENADEFIRIRGRRPNWFELRDINKAIKSFDAIELATGGVVASRDKTKQGFINFVEKAEEELIIVIGHNERGNFYFGDGSNLPLKEMASLITQKGKRHCFLSCVARKYVEGPAAETSITPLEAVAIVREVNQLVEQAEQRALQQRIQRALQRQMKANALLMNQKAYGTLPSQPWLDAGKVQPVEQDALLYKEAYGVQGLALQHLINKSITKARRQQKIKYIAVAISPGSMVVIKMIDDQTKFSDKLLLSISQRYKASISSTLIPHSTLR
jgi:hypothetical protein